MPQSLVLANGNLLVNIKEDLQVRDIYYPYVGQENHTDFGAINRVGVWVNGKFSWLSDDSWNIEIKYEKDTLVGHSTAINQDLGVKIIFSDYVYTTHDAFIRRLAIRNLKDEPQEIRVFFAYDLSLYGDKKMDTAQFEPDMHGVLHYKGFRYFLNSGIWEDGSFLNDFSVGKSQYQNQVGTWKDAEDGILSKNAIEQGSVDSCIGFKANLAGNEVKTLHHFFIAGTNDESVQKTFKRILKLTPQRIKHHTADYWREWSHKHGLNLKNVPDNVRDAWFRSLLMIRTQIDNHGAIIASNDSDIMKFNRDTYTYMWPRDGALVSMTLSRTGYWSIVERFFRFCEGIITKDGYVEHKFTPDGALGSSWHPKWKDGKPQLPIQEDESALILVALWEYARQSHMIEVVQSLFNSVVLRIGQFLIEYTEKGKNTHKNDLDGLTKPSYDLWEEQYGVFSYTSATKYAGLVAAAELSRMTGHYFDEKVFRHHALKVKDAILEHLWSDTHQRFVKKRNTDGTEDPTVDASLCFLWEMGVIAPDAPKMVATMQAIEKTLTVQTKVGGICRYSGDMYHRDWTQNGYSEKVPGNPWIITSLWLANWYIALGKKDKAESWILWATEKQNSAGILAEQMNPFTGEPLSVAPLTWSHSTFVDTVLRFSKKF